MNTKKKIVFAVTTDLSFDQRMARIAHSLAGAGYSVLLLGRSKKTSIPLRKTLYQQKRLQCYFEKGKLFYLEFNIRLFFFLSRLPIDVISSVDTDTLLPCVLIAKIRGKKCVFDAHEYFSEVPEVVNRPFTRKIWEWLANFLIPKVDLAYTVSASLRAIFTTKYQTPFHLIRNISEKCTAISLAENIGKHTLIYQGALNEGRGLEALINIMSKVNNAVLWIIGEGDLSEKLRQQAQVLDVLDKVSFLGYLIPEDLKKLTPRATIGLNLLENKGLSYYYSLANKTFDYIHAGIPAIHPNFPEYQRLNHQYSIGVLVDDLDADTLLQAIHSLTTDTKLYQRLQRNCLQAAKELNWQNEEKKLIALYDNL